ncbi:hypothetical protein D3C87_1251020 [compost metagenome]|uniref:DUF4397 domain-containing protein n=1 Tax=Cupriavidus campinensis TaxID=151783 RepID=A0AAE9L368_9BURK|nr:MULTISPECIES: DUF4397 domain-containing protein [Cupriavidus]TSP13657.1 DUF4397 domain-containing protein [Cupriavidus campinensis]URF06702.1 DUF4397 domain-containing protein [Cupriavidus campinensis]CAG2154978.1 hypothetical protein LMG19282_04778 [Cupriavidus campinensis]
MAFKRNIILGLALATTAVLAACGGGDDGIDDRVGLSKPSVRVIHAVTAGPNVDVLQNGAQTSLTNIPYKTVSGYFNVEEGNNLFAFNLAGTSTQIGSTTVSAHTGHKYTVVALPGTTSADVLQIDDPYGKGLLDTSARIRGLNASINAQNVDMYLTTPAQDIAAVTPTIAAIGYKSAVPASGQDSIYVDGGTYRLRVTTAGTKTVIFDSGALTVNKNDDWLITTIPADGFGAVVPNKIKVLVAQSSTSNATAQELVSQ